MKAKIAIVVQRYGNEVSGGGEYHAMLVAERLREKYDVEIITTTAVDYITWDNYYSAGEDNVNGIVVHRFKTEHCRQQKEMDAIANRLLPKIACGEKPNEADAYAWIDAQGPYSPDLVQYIRNNSQKYDVFIFVTYLYYHTVYGLPEVANKALFIPTAHDEPWLRLNMFQQIFNMPRKFLYNTEEERELCKSLFHNEGIPSEIVGVGIDVPQDIQPERFREKYNIEGDYLIFVGRIDASKSCDVMINHFIAYKKKHPGKLKLILVGKSNIEIPNREDIFCTGFVSEQDKFDALAGAKIVLAPSHYESLCMALLEGLAVGVPALVNGDCAVLKGHCIRGNVGKSYTNENDFCEACEQMLSDEVLWKNMSLNAKKYVQANYIWTEVMRKYDIAIEQVLNEKEDMTYMTYEERNILEQDRTKKVIVAEAGYQVERIVNQKEKTVTVVLVSSDLYTPCLGVTINSILENASEDVFYDIVVLVSDMTNANIDRLNLIAKKCENCSVRFINISAIVKSYSFYENKDHEDYTYYRLIIPQIMKTYEKVIYLDCDVVVNTDIKELYDTNMEGYLLAGCIDPYITCLQCLNKAEAMKQYFDNLGLHEVGKYIQGGVLVLNVALFNEKYTDGQLMEKASKNEYIFCDQDLLNVECKGLTKVLDCKWNILSMNEGVLSISNRMLPQKFFDEYVRAKENPCIVHYADKNIPYLKAGVDLYQFYWKYARTTPFYEYLLKLSFASEKKDEQVGTSEKEEQKTDEQPCKAPAKVKFKNKILMPLVNKMFPQGSRRRSKLKRIYFKIRGWN